MCVFFLMFYCDTPLPPPSPFRYECNSSKLINRNIITLQKACVHAVKHVQTPAAGSWPLINEPLFMRGALHRRTNSDNA